MKLQSLILFLTLSFFLFKPPTIAGQRLSPDVSKFKKVYPTTPSISLIDYIRRLPGIMVMNRGGRTQIVYRGMSSLYGENSPLFVIDNRRIGNDFEQVKNLISVVNIADISLLSGMDATIRYGLRGGNGAIVITTKQ